MPETNGELTAPAGETRPTFLGHVQIARLDHWFKNVFVLPGTVVALSADPSLATGELVWRLLVGLFAIGLVCSSNYTLNELLDAPYDRVHPTKWKRPVPSGRVNVPLAYAQWIALMAAGIAIGLTLSSFFALTIFVLWVMGCIYNIPPVRSKDLPYVDVLSEAVNNPLRMLAGWYLTGTAVIPSVSLLVSYWMIGCYFMAIKRYAEFRMIADAERSAAYRKSFRYYSERRLMVSIMFYGAHAMLFFGAFIMRYRLELILSFPLVALVMAIYLSLAFEHDSAVQRPEGLYREPNLMAAVVTCAVVMMVFLFVDVPILYEIFPPTLPVPGIKD
jgi:4-hydroxybenzoate polyprenyltransferase